MAIRVSGTVVIDNDRNANAGVGQTSATLTGSGRIDNYDDYQANHSESTNFTYAAKNPGSWANGLKVCLIDDKADQILGITTTDSGAAGAVV